ncbi:site-specific integrase [Sulfuricurvum sp.]|uniref:site-specific integrase n=1 Tax=Sulfuricurvum sp. TaxID=2025608 RepID=UPI002609196B|nr:site-specific integrase [Sulfuricurvum sp.]MDD4950485.1 site-specific integrase [Sulfuricurvum sp.]
MKYVFRTNLGYYKFARKIPNTNIQFIFSLQTKNLKIAKKITNSFLLKSALYYKMLQNMSKEEIMVRYAEIDDALNQYKEAAKQEYSIYEKTRQEHFKYNGADGSHPESIEFWLKEMQEYIGGRRTERQSIEFARKILARSTPELKQFRASLVTEEEKLTFLQCLIKSEADLLQIDDERAMRYFTVKRNQSNSLMAEDIEFLIRKVFDEKLDMGNSVIEIDKDDAIQSYKDTPKITKRMKSEAYMFVNTFSLLLKVSDKRFLNDYDDKDFDYFMETFVWIPAFQGGRKNFIATIFGNDDFMLAKYFKKFYIDNLDDDEEDLPFKIDKDYPYSDEIFNSEELLEEFGKLDVQSNTTLLNKYTILKKFFEWCVVDKNFVKKTPFGSENDYKWMQLIKDVGNAVKTRNPFSNEEISNMLRTFIEQDFFQNENLSYFYIPMISLFSGMRIEEICKLKVEHIIKENGVYCYDIKPPVKTVDSIRKVPIHPFILKNLRFLEYVKTRKDLLFDLPLTKVNGKIKYSKKYSGIFGDFRVAFVSKKRIEEDLISFHSFRHYFGTNLNNTEVKLSHISALLGHKMANNESVTYLKRDVVALNKSLNKLTIKVFKTEMDLMTVGFSKVKFKKTN